MLLLTQDLLQNCSDHYATVFTSSPPSMREGMILEANFKPVRQITADTLLRVHYQ
jgi:hypothetical protein